MIDVSKNNELKILELIPNSSIRIAVFQKDNAADDYSTLVDHSFRLG